MAKKMNRQPSPAGAKNIPQNKPAAGEDKEPRSKTSVTKSLILLLCVVTFLVYANTLSNGFAYDDSMVIKQNALVAGGMKSVPELLVTPRLWGFAHLPNDQYRPLSLVMLAAEYQLFGGSPNAMHFFNVVIFIGCVVMLFLFLNKLMGGNKPIIAFIAALLFAVHPVHTEVVANIKSRDELLCFFFAFWSLNLFAGYAGTGKLKQLLLGSLMLLLAFLSKETVITFLGVIPLVFFFYLNDNRKRSVFITVSTVVVSGLFLLLWTSVLRSHHADHTAQIDFVDNILIAAPDAASRWATAIMVMGDYLKLMVVTYPLVSDYSYSSIAYAQFSSPAAIISLVAYLLLAGTAIYRLVKFRRDPWAFGILFFLITISLFSNIVFLFSSLIGERFAFFASVGFCLSIALAFDRFIIKATSHVGLTALTSKKVLVILGPVILIFGGLTIARNAEWADNLTLYRADVKKLPQNTRLNYSLGNELVSLSFDQSNPDRFKDYEESKKYFKKAIEIYPGYHLALLTLGLAYYNYNAPDSAKYYFEKAIEVKPDYAMALFYLSNIYIQRNDNVTAKDMLKKAVAYEPEYAMALFNLGVCYQNLKINDSAIMAFRRVVAVSPEFNNYKSYELMAMDFNAMGLADSAARYVLLARQNNPAFTIPK